MSIYVGAKPVLLADHAHDAVTSASCSRCRYGVRVGERVARLADGSGWAHTWCVTRTPKRPAETAGRSLNTKG